MLAVKNSSFLLLFYFCHFFFQAHRKLPHRWQIHWGQCQSFKWHRTKPSIKFLSNDTKKRAQQPWQCHAKITDKYYVNYFDVNVPINGMWISGKKRIKKNWLATKLLHVLLKETVYSVDIVVICSRFAASDKFLYCVCVCNWCRKMFKWAFTASLSVMK